MRGALVPEGSVHSPSLFSLVSSPPCLRASVVQSLSACLLPFLALGLLCLSVLPAAAGKDPIVPNGKFEQVDPADPTRPAHWDRPDGLGVHWTTDPDDPKRGKVIRINTSIPEKDMEVRWRELGIEKWHIPNAAANAISDTYGLSFYSAAFPIVSNQAYRVTFDFKGGGKVWVRGYGMFRGEKRRRYETIVNCRSATPKEWTTLSQCFHPTRLRPRVTEMKVMLYAFYPPKDYWFDNVRIEPVSFEEYEADINENKPADW